MGLIDDTLTNGPNHSPTVNSSMSGLMTQMLISLCIVAISLAVFELLRQKRPSIFAPKTKYIKQYGIPPPRSGLFLWMRDVIAVNDSTIDSCDGRLFLLYLKNSACLFFCCSVVGAVLVIPSNCYGQSGISRSSLEYISIGNVSDGSPTLWVHTIATWIISLMGLWLIKRTNTQYLEIRHEQLLNNQQKTVIVKNVSESLCFANNLQTYFESLDIGSVYQVNIVYNVPELQKMLNEYEGHVQNAEGALMLFQRQLSKVGCPITPESNNFWEALSKNRSILSQVSPAILPYKRIGRKKVFALDYHYTKALLLEKKISWVREEITKDGKGSSTAFVSFYEYKSALIASQTLLSNELDVEIAPSPADIIWSNLHTSYRHKYLMKLIVTPATAALIIFWLIPVSAISSLTSLDQLSSTIPGLADFSAKYPFWSSLIQNVLPTILTSILMSLLPSILVLLSSLEYPESKSKLERLTTSKYFFFLVFNVFLIFTLVGTFSKSLEAVLKNPAEVITILASQLPQNSSFFINYVVLSVGTVFLEFMQIYRISMDLFRPFYQLTPRSRASQYKPVPFYYYIWIPLCSLILVISLAYSVISPIISVFAFLYFCACYLTYKYEMLYISVPLYETGGLLWQVVVNQITLGIVIFQMTMFGLLLLKKAIPCAFTILPFILATYLYRRSSDVTVFTKGKYPPLESLKQFEGESVEKKPHVKQTTTYEENIEYANDQKYENDVKSYWFNVDPRSSYDDPSVTDRLTSLWLPSDMQPVKSLETNWSVSDLP